MIISPQLETAINGQIRNEFAASAQYVAIAIYFDIEGLPDLAGFFYLQSEEERQHALKMVHFMLEAGAKPLVSDLPAARNKFDSAADAVGYALSQEETVTAQINGLVSLAKREDDHISDNFLQWFVTEQVEEVDSMGTLLQTIRHAGPSLLLVEDFVRRTRGAAPASAAAA